MRRYCTLSLALLSLMAALAAASCSDEAKVEEAPEASVEAAGEAPEAAEGELEEASGAVPARIVCAWERRGAVQIKVDGVPLAGAERVKPFEGVPVEARVPLGRSRFSVEEVGGVGAVIAEATLEVHGARVWLILVGGEGEGGAPAQIRVVRDDQGQEAEGKVALVRVINGASGLAPVDVALEAAGGQVRHFVNLGPGKGAAYRSVDLGAHKVVVRSGLGGAETPLYVQEKVELGPKTRTTLLLTGQHGRREHPMVIWSLDSQEDEG